MRAGERFRLGRLDPGESFEIVDAAGLEREQRAAEFEPADFGQRLRRALVVLALGPEPDAVARRGAARATEPLLGRGAADLFDEERVDPAMGIEPRHARQAAVDDDAHAVDGQRGFGDVGRDDDFSLLARRDGGVLLGGRKFAVQRMKREIARGKAVPQRVERALDFVRAGHENEDVALGTFSGVEQPLAGVGGEFPGRGVARLGQIFERDGKHCSRRFEHLDRLEIVREQRRLQRGRHDDDLEIGPRGLLDLPRAGQGQIALEMAFVKFVEDEDADAGQRRVFLHLAQKNALGDVENAGVARGDVFEPVLEADFAAELDAALLRDALGQQTRGEPARLQDDDRGPLPASPSSRRYCGICVDLPEPVGAWTMTRFWPRRTRARSPRRETMGREEGFKKAI